MEEKTFSFSFKCEGDVRAVDIPIDIPFYDSVEELTYVSILKYKLPIYVEKDLISRLAKFVHDENLSYENAINNSITSSKTNAGLIEEIIRDWEGLLREETSDYGDKRTISDEELFAAAYHKLVHSPSLGTMLQLEHMYAQLIRKVVSDKNSKINEISDRQTQQMNKAIDRLGKDMTEVKINEIAARHFEEQSLWQTKLVSEFETLREAQKREYRDWVMQTVAQTQASSSLPTLQSSPSTPVQLELLANDVAANGNDNVNRVPNLEESFTIHLGSQLKQMHNIRILSVNVLDMCEMNDDGYEINPQRLQSSLALYGNDLCGLVLMTDSVLGSRANKDFRDICQMSTEFHFMHVDDQLENISNVLHKHIEYKESVSKSSKHLLPGSFYITKHSNLSQLHVVFHMVCDDSLKSIDMNSRHAVVLGLRNILKTACTIDVTTLTIPLLLQYEMSEEMTVAWCVKRAELVFKCVKGFMIEMASWGGTNLKNLQFILPQGISAQVFQSLTGMLPNIFKVSNPLVLKSSTKK